MKGKAEGGITPGVMKLAGASTVHLGEMKTPSAGSILGPARSGLVIRASLLLGKANDRTLWPGRLCRHDIGWRAL
jgi:hypothetical protein